MPRWSLAMPSQSQNPRTVGRCISGGGGYSQPARRTTSLLVLRRRNEEKENHSCRWYRQNRICCCCDVLEGLVVPVFGGEGSRYDGTAKNPGSAWSVVVPLAGGRANGFGDSRVFAAPSKGCGRTLLRAAKPSMFSEVLPWGTPST